MFSILLSMLPPTSSRQIRNWFAFSVCCRVLGWDICAWGSRQPNFRWRSAARKTRDRITEGPARQYAVRFGRADYGPPSF